MNAIFQPVVGQIVDLVRTQVTEVQDVMGKAPKVRYLRRRRNAWY
jgi:hypothetical protein